MGTKSENSFATSCHLPQTLYPAGGQVYSPATGVGAPLKLDNRSSGTPSGLICQCSADNILNPLKFPWKLLIPMESNFMAAIFYSQKVNCSGRIYQSVVVGEPISSCYARIFFN